MIMLTRDNNTRVAHRHPEFITTVKILNIVNDIATCFSNHFQKEEYLSRVLFISTQRVNINHLFHIQISFASHNCKVTFGMKEELVSEFVNGSALHVKQHLITFFREWQCIREQLLSVRTIKSLGEHVQLFTC